MCTFYLRGLWIIGALLSLTACAPLVSSQRPAPGAMRANALIVASQEHDLLFWLMAGEFALASGDLHLAATHYANAARLSDDPQIAEQATRIPMLSKNWERVRSALTRWQTLTPDQPGVRQTRAMLALIDGEGEAAYADLLSLAREPDSSGWHWVGQALLSAPDKTLAGELLERLAQPELLGDQAQTWIAISQLAFKLDRKSYARTLAERTAARFPTGEVYTWLAQLTLNEGDKQHAKQLFAQAVQYDPKNTHVRIAYATLLGDMGENIAAVNVLAKGPQDDYTYTSRAAYAARVDNKMLLAALYTELQTLTEPRTSTQLMLLGQIAELIERKSEAMPWYSQVGETEERWFDAQLRIAILTDKEGQTELALNRLHELQTRAGDDVKSLTEAFLLEAELLNRHKRGDEALEVYTRGLAILPEDTRLLYARALLNETLEHPEVAEQDLRRVVALKPDDADALNALGYTLADRTEHKEEALALIEKALSLKPEEAAIIDSLGWVQYRLGNLDEAIKQLQRAYTKQPDAEIAAHLGEVLWMSGKKEEARNIWEQGRKKDAQNKILLDTLQRLGV